MEELSAIWTTSEESAYDLKQKILSNNLELESAKNLVTESQQNANNLFELLQVAYKEGDEARNELQKVLNKMNYTCAPVDQLPNVVQPDSPILISPKENSGIFESNNLFESCTNPQLHDSLLVDSLFGALPSPNFLNINYSSNIKSTTSMSTGLMASSGLDAKFDYIAQGKSLPEKGKLMQAVMEAGPLLQTLLVTGSPPLPQWRNPPTMQPPKNSSISLQGCKENLASSSEKPVSMASSSNFLNSISYPRVSQTCSAAMLDFSIPSVPSCKRSRPLNSSSYFDQQLPTAKKCRLNLEQLRMSLLM